MVAAPEAKTWACNFLEVVISISAGNLSRLSCRLAWRSWPRTNGLDSGVGSVGDRFIYIICGMNGSPPPESQNQLFRAWCRAVCPQHPGWYLKAWLVAITNTYGRPYKLSSINNVTRPI